MPVVHLKIGEELHGKLRRWCFDRGQSMQGALLDCVSRLVSDPVRGAEPVTTKASDVKSVGGRTVGATTATGATEYRYKPDDCGFHNFKTSGGKRVCVKCGFKDE